MRRFDMRLPAVVRLEGASEFHTETQNVSARGVFLLSRPRHRRRHAPGSHANLPAPHHPHRRGPRPFHRPRHPRRIPAAFSAHRHRRHDRRLRIPPLRRQHRFPQRHAERMESGELKSGLRLQASARAKTFTTKDTKSHEGSPCQQGLRDTSRPLWLMISLDRLSASSCRPIKTHGRLLRPCMIQRSANQSAVRCNTLTALFSTDVHRAGFCRSPKPESRSPLLVPPALLRNICHAKLSRR